MNHFSNKLIVKDPFEMPAVDDTTVLTLRECADLVPHCWIWNESVGYLEVVKYSGYDIYVTVKNVGMKENATSGTIFPSCMEFLITAPNATPIIDNTVTCLKADFKCPTVGQEALMSVDSTSAIRVGDIIIVDTRYQYLVTEIINEHTMKVLNEEKGKEGGVIDVKCNECVPVKILESTHCCEALQDQVDDIYNRIDTKKSVVSNNVLLSVDHGLDAISDVSYDIELDIDTDLSKYDNTTSAFITLGDIPALPSDTDLSHYDNSTSGFITSSSLPTVNDATLTIYESDGVTPFIEFTANAATAVTATLPASGTTLAYFEESYDSGTDTATFKPKYSTATNFNTGHFYNVFTQNIKYNDATHSYISFPAADGGSIIINNGTSGTYGTNYGNIIFDLGGSDRLHINDQDITTYVDIIPSSDSTGSLGNNSTAFAGMFTKDMYADRLIAYTGNTSGTINFVSDVFVSYKKLTVKGANLEIENGTKIEFAYNYLNFTQDNQYTIGNGNRKAKEMYSHAYLGASDIRSKENIQSYDKCVLDKLDKINPITYTFKNGNKDDVKLGISAQELQEQEPLCVTGGETKNGDVPLSIDLLQLIVFNMKAIKELSAKVKDLESKLGEKDADSKVLEK